MQRDLLPAINVV